MLIKTAEYGGFCSGVRRAVNMLQAELDKGVKIYLLGKIIHNDTFIRELERRGVEIINDGDVYGRRLEGPAAVIIRAHGIRKELSEELARLEDIYIVDATCECVKRMHVIVRENTNERTRAIIFGDAGHPEIAGLDSYITGEREIYADFERFFERFSESFAGGNKNNENSENNENNEKKLIILAQTTHNIDDWKKIKDFMKSKAGGGGADAVCYDLFDTVCSATDKRQKEAERLSKECDIMLVIGSPGSANTQRLFEICKKNCAESFIIETSEQLPYISSHGQCAVKVGITAGASTPDGIIKEVKKIMAESNRTDNTEFTDQTTQTTEGTSENGQNIAEGGIPGEQDGEKSFEDMLNESFVTLNRGERVKGIVSHISGSEIYVDLGGKYTGVLSFDEISDSMSGDVNEMFKIGDEIETQIIKTNDHEGTALLSRKRIDANEGWEKINRHLEAGTTAEGKVVHAVNGGIIVLVESVKVFVPASHANVSRDTELQTLVNKHVKLKIIDVNQQKHRAIASIRNAVNEERKALEEKIWAEIEHGKKYEGVVKSITSYGAFVDIGGIDGMVHKSELSWLRVGHPSEVVKSGDVIQVYIKDFNTEKRHIALGYRDENENPWVKFQLDYQVGDIAEVKILSMMPFGAFAEVIPGVDGLIHISEITDKRISKPSEVLNIGDIVKAKITKIDTENKKLSLSILAAEEAEEAAIAEEAGVQASDSPVAEAMEAEAEAETEAKVESEEPAE